MHSIFINGKALCSGEPGSLNSLFRLLVEPGVAEGSPTLALARLEQRYDVGNRDYIKLTAGSDVTIGESDASSSKANVISQSVIVPHSDLMRFETAVCLDHGLDVPESWIVFTSTRPILGHKTLENGLFVRGRFRAAVDPKDSLADRYIEENRKLKACAVVACSKEEMLAMALLASNYAEEYLDKFKGEELWKVLLPQVNDLSSLELGDVLRLRNQVQKLGLTTIVSEALTPDEHPNQMPQADASGDLPPGNDFTNLKPPKHDVDGSLPIDSDQVQNLKQIHVYSVLDQCTTFDDFSRLRSLISNERQDLVEAVKEASRHIALSKGWVAQYFQSTAPAWADYVYTVEHDKENGPSRANPDAVATAASAIAGTVTLETSVRPSGRTWHTIYVSMGQGKYQSHALGTSLPELIEDEVKKASEDFHSKQQFWEAAALQSEKYARQERAVAVEKGFKVGLRLGNIIPNTGKLLRAAFIHKDHGNGTYDIQGVAGPKDALISGMSASSLVSAIERAQMKAEAKRSQEIKVALKEDSLAGHLDFDQANSDPMNVPSDAGLPPSHTEHRFAPALVPTFSTYAQAYEWISKRSLELGIDKEAFSGTVEYEQAYPQIQALYTAEVSQAEKLRQLTFTEANLVEGDRLTITVHSAGKSEILAGSLFLRDMTPFVRLDTPVMSPKGAVSDVPWDGRWTKENSCFMDESEASVTTAEKSSASLKMA
ncbi:Uncharacterised protein [Pseudomonas luteola]|uniref:Uncharacterized protein n=1 Tax=Pseudomonas luteola TaxID=47886 RepID=A0A2X2DZA1_PSELU|nr:Uncharacterised protein [Pseudomonas luteola]